MVAVEVAAAASGGVARAPERGAMSPGSMAGNSATRNWLRPSLRYPSVSRMPWDRRMPLTVAAGRSSSRSMVATTWLRMSGSVT